MTAGNDDPSSENFQFYWSEDARIAPDGTISLPISGYAGQGTLHWHGRLQIASGENDYLLWAWIVSDPTRGKGLKSPSDIESLRRLFAES